ncbi:MAG TPA: hypothetical protein DCR32_00865 [Opitutae bacterium]|nr:hypothetical protein [Opitutae bacterium]
MKIDFNQQWLRLISIGILLFGLTLLIELIYEGGHPKELFIEQHPDISGATLILSLATCISTALISWGLQSAQD